MNDKKRLEKIVELLSEATSDLSMMVKIQNKRIDNLQEQLNLMRDMITETIGKA